MRKAWVAVALVLASQSASGQTEPDAGPPVEAAGRAIELSPRPETRGWVSACSFRHPLCVHAPNSSGPLLEALSDAERAWETATGALALPPPDPASDTRAFDVYLDGPEETLLFERDPRAGLDRASAFARVDGRLRGCSLEAAITRRMLSAIAMRVAPSMDVETRAGTTSALAELITPCAFSTISVQMHPELAIADPSSNGGSSLFFGWVDDAFSRSPGATITALWALSPTMTPSDAAHWYDEPDAFDVLRTTFKGALRDRSTIDDLFVDYGVARAFVGSAADETHFFESRRYGDAGKVPIGWDVPWPDKARRLASPVPVAPTGSSYVLVHRDGAKPGSRLRIESEWEELMRLRWVAVKLDSHGKEQARIAVITPDKATKAQMTVTELDDTASVLLVATNVGAWDAPFDPDDAPWEPHGWLLTIASE